MRRVKIMLIMLIMAFLFTGCNKNVELETQEIEEQSLQPTEEQVEETSDEEDIYKDVNMATRITGDLLENMIENKQTFVLFVGSDTCSHCHHFYRTINRYVLSGHVVFYVDLSNEQEVSESTIYLIARKLSSEVAANRKLDILYTPTSVYVKDGVFADAIVGAVGMSGNKDYETFCEVMEGNYIGKEVYHFIYD